MKYAVIGVGSMGMNHARIAADIADVELVGVADADIGTSRSVIGRHGGRPYSDYRNLLDKERPDAVSIAVPTIDHLEVGLSVIERGIHLLVEKPIAYSMEDGRQMISAAEKAGVILMVGHIERFNSAVVELKRRLGEGELGRVFQIDARRQGPFPHHVRDVGVIIDLAVHDVDVMRFITGSEVIRVYAETERRIHSKYEDLLCGILRLDHGTVGTLAVNWLTPTKIRELQVTGERGMFMVNYITQDLYLYENASALEGDWETMRVLRGVSEGRMIRHPLSKKEPLREEVEAFIKAIQGEIALPVTGEDGVRVLEIAHAFARSGSENRSISIEASSYSQNIGS